MHHYETWILAFVNLRYCNNSSRLEGMDAEEKRQKTKINRGTQSKERNNKTPHEFRLWLIWDFVIPLAARPGDPAAGHEPLQRLGARGKRRRFSAGAAARHSHSQNFCFLPFFLSAHPLESTRIITISQINKSQNSCFIMMHAVTRLNLLD